MDSYTINTSSIGTIEVSNRDGLFGDYEFELDGQKTPVSLFIIEDFLNKDNASTVEYFIDHVPAMYQKAKNYISLSASSNEVIQEYISCHIEEPFSELVSLFHLDSIDQLTPELFVNSLELLTIRISPDSNGVIECFFDFSLPENYTDELLVISFDSTLEIHHITQES